MVGQFHYLKCSGILLKNELVQPNPAGKIVLHSRIPLKNSVAKQNSSGSV
jgi:hypothetical protein